MTAPAAARRNDIDWLRVAATYLLFVFHSAMVFNPAPFYHIRNADLSVGMLVLCGFIGLWHMPLFFILAGWSTHASLRIRGKRGYLRERMSKLLLPLAAGVVLFCPLIKYLELTSGLDLSHTGLRVSAAQQESFRMLIPSGLGVLPPIQEMFLEFLPTFFTRLDRFTWAHLWFVAYLFTFSVLYLPIIDWIGRRPARTRALGSGWIYLPMIPLALIQLTLRERWPGIQNLYDDWANVAYYSVYLLAGVLLASQPSFEQALHREWKRALGLGVATCLVLLLGVLQVHSASWVMLTGSAVAGWCFVVAALGIGHAFLAPATKGLRYLRESAFPVYVLHQIAIVVPGYLIIQTSWGIGTKFLLLLTVSIALTLATYHAVVRRSAIVGVLFGVAPRASGMPSARHMTSSAGTAALLAILIAAPARTAAHTPIGMWYAEGGAAKVAIEPCGPTLCGTVVWLRSPWDEDGCDMRDRHNPDPALRDRPVLGLRIVAGFAREPSPDGRWTGGTIYDPSTGKTYSAQAALDGQDRLELRGYVGFPIFGRTTRWIRESGRRPECASTLGHP